MTAAKTFVAGSVMCLLALAGTSAQAQTFSDPVTYTLVNENPGRAATGDLDGDGDPDIAVPTYVSGSPGYVEVLLDLSAGSTGAPTVYDVGNDPRSVTAADLDGDGDLDLAVANRGDGTVSVLTNRGDGTFEAAVDHAAGSYPFVVVAGDLNGDGLADLAVANTSAVSWLANNGDGTFAAPQSFSFSGIVALDIGEIEGDTDLDLVVLEKGGGSSSVAAWVTVLWNDGSGTFAASPRYDGGSWSDGWDYALHPSVDSVALGDVTGNGHLDVLVGATRGWWTLPLDGSPLGRVQVLENWGGSLMPGESRGSCHDNPPQLDTGDLDGDGHLDIVTGRVYFLNGGTGYFGGRQSHGGGGEYVTVDDLYPDGLPDLVLPKGPDSVRVVFQGDVCPGDPNKTDPGQCGCGQPDTDTDADGVADCLDRCPGQPDTDADGDGVLDCLDPCPDDPWKVDPGVCGCGVPDVDSDGDGTLDCLDDCLADPNKIEPGACGCGIADLDSDEDGVLDCDDVCRGYDDALDCNGNGVPDGCDIAGSPFENERKLTASDAGTGDALGQDVSIDGDTIVVGARLDDDLGDLSGAAYVYRHDAASENWVEEQKLSASDGGTEDFFGSSVSVNGDTLVIGAVGDDDLGSTSGSAYVYRYHPLNQEGERWVEEQKLNASDGGSIAYFGSSVSIDGGALVVGAQWDDGETLNSGSVYVYRYDEEAPVGERWVEEQKLSVYNVDARLGTSVSIHGDVIVAGAPGAGFSGQDYGYAYVYRYDPANPVGERWAWESTLRAFDPADDDSFGASVSIHDDTIVVGASGDDDLGYSSGSAYVYRYDAENDDWVLESKLTASEGAAYNYFGRGVSIRDDRIVAGAPERQGQGSGGAYVYRYDAVNQLWTEEKKLTASDGADGNKFGSSVGIHGDRILVGASEDDDLGADSGSAYIYDLLVTTSDCNGDGVPDDCQPETDSDGDGVADCIDQCPGTPDTDSDGDGVADCVDQCPGEPDTDSDGDGTLDCLDGCPDDRGKVDPGVCGCDVPDADSDGDGTLDCLDGCPDDPGKVDPGVCGCGEPDTDSDGDGVADCFDQCPGEPDTDSDGDGVLDCLDQCPGQPDTDSDGDGVMDCVDVCPGFVDTLDCNGNGVPDGCDIDRGWFEDDRKLTASDGAADDVFGMNVEIDGDAFVVAAPYDDDRGTDSGSVYVHRYDAVTGGWVEEQKLTASDGEAGDSFGRYLSIHGDTIAVGAWGDDDRGNNAGSAYVYRYDPTRPEGERWVEEQKLTASDGDAGDEFGEDIAIHGDTIAIGAWADEDRGTESGSVYVYRYDPTRPEGERWVEEQKLTASDGVAYDLFGYRVSIHGDAIVIGAMQDDDQGTDSGSAYVYRYDPTRPEGERWVEEQKLTASDGDAWDIFGLGVAIHGDTIVVGAPYNDHPVFGTDVGSAYVYRYDPTRPEGERWVETSMLTAPRDIGALFGEGVSTDGDTIVVGAAYHDDPVLGADAGSVYVYRYDGASGFWNESDKLTAPDGAVGDKLGYGVSVDGGTIVAGAYGRNDLGTDSGAVYTFERSGMSSDCNRDGVPDECQPDNDLDGWIDACDCDPANAHCTTDCTDGDFDGYCVTSDCDDAVGLSWEPPAEVAGLRFDAGTKDDLSWDRPSDMGGHFGSLRYDAVRSDFAADFGAATCIETDTLVESATDAATPLPGSVFHYLVRAQNDCPTGGNLGHDSQGGERSAPTCP